MTRTAVSLLFYWWSHIHLRWPEESKLKANFNLWMNYSFKQTQKSHAFTEMSLLLRWKIRWIVRKWLYSVIIRPIIKKKTLWLIVIVVVLGVNSFSQQNIAGIGHFTFKKMNSSLKKLTSTNHSKDSSFTLNLSDMCMCVRVLSITRPLQGRQIDFWDLNPATTFTASSYWEIPYSWSHSNNSHHSSATGQPRVLAGPEANNPAYRALTPNTFNIEPGNTFKLYTQSCLIWINFHSLFSIDHARCYNLMPHAEIYMTKTKA